MNTAGRLEELLAALLRYGSWSACAAIGLGFALALIGSHSPARNPAVVPHRIATMGIALFILLPMLRVLLMFLVFIRERDFRFACIAGSVLAIILLGIVLGLPAT
ncbi:MAG TPA: DUF1634 domain-containing protein [Bryobacteraceae bacterium]|jgi:hypothetical protein|nr:DUF1634 domain-containing protein [Bryobacteraceae bacterium]